MNAKLRDHHAARAPSANGHNVTARRPVVSWLALGVALLAVACAGRAADAATTTIDDFTQIQAGNWGGLGLDLTGQFPAGSPVTATDDIIDNGLNPLNTWGGKRTTTLTATRTVSGVRNALAGLDNSSPEVYFNGDFDITQPILELSYRGLLPASTPTGTARVTFLDYDATGSPSGGSPVPLSIGLFASDGTNTGFIQQVLDVDVTSSSPVTIPLPLALASNSFNDLNFALPIDLKFTFSIPDAEADHKDFTFRLLELETTEEAVPEPATGAAAALGLAALTSYGLIRRRRRRMH